MVIGTQSTRSGMDDYAHVRFELFRIVFVMVHEQFSGNESQLAKIVLLVETGLIGSQCVKDAIQVLSHVVALQTCFQRCLPFSIQYNGVVRYPAIRFDKHYFSLLNKTAAFTPPKPEETAIKLFLADGLTDETTCMRPSTLCAS